MLLNVASSNLAAGTKFGSRRVGYINNSPSGDVKLKTKDILSETLPQQRFEYSLGDYGIGHKEDGVANSEQEMLAAAAKFAEEYATDPYPIELDRKEGWIIIGEPTGEDNPNADGNFLPDGRYIIGQFKVI